MAEGLAEKERLLRRLVAEMRLMEGTANALRERLQMVVATSSELRLAKRSLEDLVKIEADNDLLVPIGGSAFIKARLGQVDKVLVGIGANISMEMEYEEALGEVSERLEEMEKAQRSIEQQLVQIMAQLESHRGQAERLSAEIQQALQGAA